MQNTMQISVGKIAFLLFMLLPLGDALAQDTGYKADTSQPIEIASDTLEVLQNENKAIFKGNVEAIQGKMKLKSNTMTVFYKGNGVSPPSGSEGPSKISRINVDGNVLISTPKETAKGDKGTYNVDSKLITLEGGVVLTQGKNVVKGDRMEYNLASGKSKLLSSASPDGGKQRVKGLFVPDDTGNKVHID